MKKFINLFLILLTSSTYSFGQAGSVLPNPADVTDSVVISIDLLDNSCGCPGLQGAYAPTAEDPLYIWTWMPFDRVGSDPFANGVWGNSNEALKMKQDTVNPNKWNYKMIPTEFYNVSPSTVYNKGFAFLAKKKDGSAIVGENFEAKSADQIVPITSVGCVDKFCPYPTNYTDQDYLSVVYNQKKETSVAFANGDVNSLYLYPKISLVGSENTFFTIPGLTFATLEDRQDLKMKNLGDQKFESNIFTLRELFQLQPGQEISEVQWRLGNPSVSPPNNLCPGQNDFPGCE